MPNSQNKEQMWDGKAGELDQDEISMMNMKLYIKNVLVKNDRYMTSFIKNVLKMRVELKNALDENKRLSQRINDLLEFVNLLEWIYQRMINVHGENNLSDYMIRLSQIIKILKGGEL